MSDGKLHVKNDKEFKKLSKPIQRAKVEKDMPGAFDRLECLERRVEILEKLYRQTNNLLLAKCAEIEGLKNVIRKDLC